jgi:hypothetical protein
VVWKGDEMLGQQVNTFTDWMLKSQYFTKSVAEYGVGPGTAKGVLVIPVTPPATISQAGGFDAIINANLGKIGWPKMNSNLIFSFVLNPKTVVTAGGQPASCVEFDGYHSMSATQGLPYLVNAYCANPSTMMPDWDELTVTISHEIAEAVTDPTADRNHVFGYLGGGETGDLCLELNAKITENNQTYLVQRLYSDKTAGLGNANPCQNDDGPYFGAALVGNDKTDPSVVNVALNTKGTGSATFKMEPFSYDAANMGPIAFMLAGDMIPPGITFSPDFARRADPKDPTKILGMKLFGNPGSTTTVTVNVDSTYQADGRPIQLLFFSKTKTGRLNIWWGNLVIQ